MSKLNQLWQTFESWIFEQPSKNITFFLSQIHRLVRILFALVGDVSKGHISLHAMSLVYTTILSVVPMLALSFSVLKAFNVQDQFTPMLFAFLEPMGEKGIEIHHKVLGFVDNIEVGVLGVFGFLMLFYTVISLVQKIERAFNAIWHAPQLRSLGERFSHYLSVILVGPVLVVAAISLTATTMNSSVILSLSSIEPFGTLLVTLTKLTPFLMIIAAFSFFYVMMPNTKVKPISAIFGGVIAGSAWQASSLVFTAVVVNSAKYDAIYSGFAVGILLLIWLYMNWLILLLGSSIAFYHQYGNHISRFDVDNVPAELIEKVGLDIMCFAAQRYESNEQPVLMSELESFHAIPAVLSRKIVHKLIESHLLVIAGEKSDQIVPASSTDNILVSSILAALRGDHHESRGLVVCSEPVEKLVLELNSDIFQKTKNITLRDLLHE